MTIPADSFSLKIERLIYFLTLGVAITFPFSIWVNNLFSLLLIAAWLFQFKWPKKNSILVLFSIYFLMHVIGLAYTSNMDQGLFELEKKVSFIIFPVALSGKPQFTKKQLHTILAGFALSCFFATLLCIASAVNNYFTCDTTKYFFYYDLVEVLGIHPVYFSMYICFSIFIVTYLYFRATINFSIGIKLLFAATLLYLIIFVFLLSARAEILAFSIILFGSILIFFYQSKRLHIAVGLISVFLIFFAGLIFLNPTNLDRFKEAINYKSQYSIDKQWGGRALRLLKWDCSLEIIRKNPLLGVGAGDAQDELQKCYVVKNYGALLYWPNTKYNSHNQYLQSAVDFGLVGLSVVTLCLFVPARRAIKTKDYLFLSFISLFSICCLTESMLEANKGIAFFAFFVSLFMNQVDKNE